MKIFIKKLAILGILILAIATVLQIGIVYRLKDKTVNGHDIYTIGKNLDYDVIAFGNSRCANHFVPRIFQDSMNIKFLNMGILGHGEISFAYMQLKQYLKHSKAPKVVILSFDPYVSPGPLNLVGNTNYNEKHSFSRYAFFAQEDREEIVNYFNYNWAEQYLPCYAVLKYKIFMDCILRKNGKLWDKNRYLTFSYVWDSVSAPILADERNGNNFRYFRSKKDSIKLEVQFLDSFCKSKNIQFICVQGPVYKDLFDAKSFAVTGQICRELNIPFFDKALLEFCADAKRYYDPNHLNDKGASDFCRTLCKDTAFTSLIYNAIGRK